MKVSIKEAATYLKFSDQYVRRLVAEGRLGAEKIGSNWALSWKEVLEFSLEQPPADALDHSRQYKTTKGKLKCLSFFSGAMGMDIGLETANIETLLACEVDKASRKTIEANRPNIALIGDISNYTSQQILDAAKIISSDVDLMVGGPPCQAFSSAGKRQGFKDDRGNVFLTFIDRILDIRPKYAIIENVRGLLSAPLNHVPHKDRTDEYGSDPDHVRGSALMHIVNRLRDAGYGVSFNLYNAANFGAPQKRERVVIICCREGQELPYLTPTHSEHGEYGLPKWRNLRSAIDGLGNITHDHVNFPDKRLKYYKLLSGGQNWKNLPEDLQKEALGKSYYAGGGKTGFLRRISWDKPAPTLVTHPAMPATDLCHPDELRPLSVQEYKRIQEFPDEWEILGSKIDQYKQIGNAVPVSLGSAIGRLIQDAEVNQLVEPPTDFAFSRYRATSHLEWEEIVLKQLSKVTSTDRLVA